LRENLHVELQVSQRRCSDMPVIHNHLISARYHNKYNGSIKIKKNKKTLSIVDFVSRMG